LKEAESSCNQLQSVKMTAQLNSKQMSVVAGNWRQLQLVESSMQPNSTQMKER
jgi:hypothetical protein